MADRWTYQEREMFLGMFFRDDLRMSCKDVCYALNAGEQAKAELASLRAEIAELKASRDGLVKQLREYIDKKGLTPMPMTVVGEVAGILKDIENILDHYDPPPKLKPKWSETYDSVGNTCWKVYIGGGLIGHCLLQIIRDNQIQWMWDCDILGPDLAAAKAAVEKMLLEGKS